MDDFETAGAAWLVRLRDPALLDAVTCLRVLLGEADWPDAGDWTSQHASEPRPARNAASRGVVLVWVDEPLDGATVDALLRDPRATVLSGPTLAMASADTTLGGSAGLAEAAGLWLGGATPVHDVRVRAAENAPWLRGRLADHEHAGAAHLGEHTHVRDRLCAVDKTADDVEVLLTANLGLVPAPLATWRASTSVAAWTLGSTPTGVADRSVARLLALVLRHVTGLPAPRPARVGLLGYGAIGHEHSRAVRSVPGLELTAVCDRSAERVAAALDAAPSARAAASAEDLLADPDVDVVVVSTPPSSHAEWALRALEAGKHVVVEKPFAIRTADADDVLDVAARRGLLACVYQNRRFDPDYLALRRLVRAGALGEVFHLEAFVGGFGHPCNLWHSDEDVSGGAFYDWGAHVLDQVMDLLPGDVEHVTAAAHKRRWHDVTNADHTRVTLRLAGGIEAEFVYSDLAAVLKPRWYVLGTEGAVVGHWRSERVVARNDVGTLAEDVLAPADSPPRLELHSADGSVTAVALPPGRPYPFHRELADRLQLGMPMSVTGQQSRRVLAVMEAAAASARSGGTPVIPR